MGVAAQHRHHDHGAQAGVDEGGPQAQPVPPGVTGAPDQQQDRGAQGGDGDEEPGQ